VILQPVFKFPVTFSDCERVFLSLRNFHKAFGVPVLAILAEDCLREASISHLEKSAVQNGIRCISFTHAQFSPVVRELFPLTLSKSNSL
jgi:hypothetical protein